MHLSLLGLVLLCFLPACMKVGPAYNKPQPTMPSSYAQKGLQGSIKDLACWWTLFNDACLTSLIEKAVDANYDLRIACQKIEELRAEFGIKKADMYPYLFLIGFTQREKFSTNYPLYQNLEPNPLTNINHFFQAFWEIDFWGRLRRGKDAACFRLQAEVEQMRDVYVILLADVATTYIDIKALQEKISLLERQVEIDEALLAYEDDLFNAGIANNIVFQEQRETLQESKNLLIGLKTLKVQAHNALAVLLGENPSCFTSCRAIPGIPTAQQLIDIGLPSELLQRRPDIRRAERLIAAANQEVGIAVSNYFPRFFLLGSSGLQSDKISTYFNSGSIGWSIGPGVFWPILTFGRIKYNIQVKQAQERQAALSYCQTVLRAFQDVEDALIQFLNTSKQLEVLQEKLAAAQAKKSLVKGLFDAGLANELADLSAQKEYVTIAWDVADAQQKAAVALVVLYKSLGGGW